MRKLFTTLILFLMIAIFAAPSFAAQGRTIDLKLGIFNPKDAKTGMILGGRFGSQIDNRLNVGLAIDYYHKGYDVSSKSGGIQIVEARFSSNMVPIMLDVEAKFPLQYNAEIVPFAHLGFGYEILWNKEEYANEPDESRTYNGFGWIFGGGIDYKIGYSSDLRFELFYNGCTLKRDEGKNEAGWLISELDVSGLGARIGVRLKSF